MGAQFTKVSAAALVNFVLSLSFMVTKMYIFILYLED